MQRQKEVSDENRDEQQIYFQIIKRVQQLQRNGGLRREETEVDEAFMTAAAAAERCRGSGGRRPEFIKAEPGGCF
jgi:hypothetical protein